MKSKLRFAFTISVLSILSVSVYFNIKQMRERLWVLHFNNANTRVTYDDFHHIKAAQKYASGKGVKIGILDKYFGYEQHKWLYTGGEDFIHNLTSLQDIDEHGFWMATTLKEIAPDAEIFALNVRSSDSDLQTKAIIEAIDWAILHQIDILSYSAEAFNTTNSETIDKAIQKARDHQVSIVFLHYDHPLNILCYGFFPPGSGSYQRYCDVNVFHFDYNLLLIKQYKNQPNQNQPDDGNMAFFSFSSMPQVVAGVIALLKEKNKNLSPEEIKEILIQTSYEMCYQGYQVKHVLDAFEAILSVEQSNTKH